MTRRVLYAHGIASVALALAMSAAISAPPAEPPRDPEQRLERHRRIVRKLHKLKSGKARL